MTCDADASALSCRGYANHLAILDLHTLVEVEGLRSCLRGVEDILGGDGRLESEEGLEDIFPLELEEEVVGCVGTSRWAWSSTHGDVLD